MVKMRKFIPVGKEKNLALDFNSEPWCIKNRFASWCLGPDHSCSTFHTLMKASLWSEHREVSAGIKAQMSRLAQTASGGLTVRGTEPAEGGGQESGPAPPPTPPGVKSPPLLCSQAENCPFLHGAQTEALHLLHHPSAAQHNLQPPTTDLTLVLFPPAAAAAARDSASTYWRRRLESRGSRLDRDTEGDFTVFNLTNRYKQGQHSATSCPEDVRRCICWCVNPAEQTAEITTFSQLLLDSTLQFSRAQIILERHCSLFNLGGNAEILSFTWLVNSSGIVDVDAARLFAATCWCRPLMFELVWSHV